MDPHPVTLPLSPGFHPTLETPQPSSLEKILNQAFNANYLNCTLSSWSLPLVVPQKQQVSLGQSLKVIIDPHAFGCGQIFFKSIVNSTLLSSNIPEKLERVVHVVLRWAGREAWLPRGLLQTRNWVHGGRDVRQRYVLTWKALIFQMWDALCRSSLWMFFILQPWNDYLFYSSLLTCCCFLPHKYEPNCCHGNNLTCTRVNITVRHSTSHVIHDVNNVLQLPCGLKGSEQRSAWSLILPH